MRPNLSSDPLILGSDTPGILQRELPQANVLSVILDVNPASPANQGGGLAVRARHLLAPLNAPETLVQFLIGDLDSAQRSTRTRLYYLWNEHGHLRQRLVDTRISIPEQARLGAPDVQALEAALDASPRTLIALIDREWGRVFRVHLDQIHELDRLENVMELDDSFRQQAPTGPVRAQLADTDPHQGGGRRLLSRDTDNDVLDRKARHQDGQFYHALAQRLGQLQQAGAAEGVPEPLILAGPVRSRASFRAALPPALERVLAGEFAVTGDASAAAVLEAAQEALSLAGVAADTALLDAARERGVHGLSETLSAVQEGRVSQVLVAGDGAEVSLWRDPAGVLFADAPPNQSPAERLSLAAALPELRERFGLRVSVLSGEAAADLTSELGGLAGLLRY